jgi:hypothetical protein
MSKFADLIAKDKVPKKQKRKRTSKSTTQRPSSVADPKAGLGQTTASGFAHLKNEEAKFDSMTKTELMERLQRIRNPQKLRAFILTAINRNSEDLLTEACKLASRLGYGYLIPRSASISNVSEKDVGIGKEIPSTRLIRPE